MLYPKLEQRQLYVIWQSLPFFPSKAIGLTPPSGVKVMGLYNVGNTYYVYTHTHTHTHQVSR